MNKLFTNTAAAALLCAVGIVVAQADVGPAEAAAIEIAAVAPAPAVSAAAEKPVEAVKAQ